MSFNDKNYNSLKINGRNNGVDCSHIASWYEGTEENCLASHHLIMKKTILRQTLLYLNKDNENISKSLLLVKKEYEALKSEMKMTLYNINIKREKQKILTVKNKNTFLIKQKILQQKQIESPLMSQLEDLIKHNNILVTELGQVSTLLQLTQKQYNAMLLEKQNIFKKKVCEFCEVFVKYLRNKNNLSTNNE